MIIKIDIDGVLRNTFKRITEIYNSTFNDNLDYKIIEEYKVDKIFPKIRETFNISARKWFFDDRSLEVFFMADIIDGVKDSIDKLISAGHIISIVSYQNTFANKIHTLMWLNKHHINYHNICFTDKKYLIKGDYLVDDNIEFLESEKLYGNSKPILIKTSYSKNCNKFESYNSLNDFVEHLLNNSNNENN